MVLRTNSSSQNGKTPGRRSRAAIYARYSSRFQHSIDDQVRVCREWAERNGIEVKHVFSDQAITGKSSRRTGLRELHAALAENKVDVVIIFTTNRLYRKMYRSLQFVEEEIVDRNKRCVFVQSGIDTADTDDWRQRLQMYALIDEFLVQTIAKHVQAAHEGLLLQVRVFGTVTFGYSGDPIEGVTTRLGRPARRLIIDPVTSVWVKKVFDWFTRLRLSIAAIVRRLNAEGCPLPPRSSARRWTRTGVRRLLTNARYIGDWAYGTTKSVWNNKESYSRQVDREDPIRTLQIEELRILDEVTWANAQERLHHLAEHAGRRSIDGDRQSRPLILNGLMLCAEHKRPLYVGGTHGRYMFCRGCQEAAEPFLFSMLPRQLTVQLVCEKLADLVLGDEELVAECIDQCQQQIDGLAQPDLQRLDELRRKVARQTSNIQFILEAPGETDEDLEENRSRIEQLRSSRASTQREIAEIEAQIDAPKRLPTVKEIRDELARLAEIFRGAAESEDPEELAAVRTVIDQLTNGEILVSQCGERKRHQGWLRLSFTVDLLSHIASQQGFTSTPQNQQIEIDIREPSSLDADADRVKAMLDQGQLMKDIATELGKSRSYVTKLMKHWYESRGLQVPDGRTRRSTLVKKQQKIPMYRQIADQATELWNAGLSVSEIARQCQCSGPTVNRAIAEWHESRGLTVPNRKSRRGAGAGSDA